MAFPGFCRVVRASLLALLPFSLFSIAQAQGAKKAAPETPIADADADHVQQRSEWFLLGRVVPGKSSAYLRYRAYQAKMRARAARFARAQAPDSDSQPAASSGAWTPGDVLAGTLAAILWSSRKQWRRKRRWWRRWRRAAARHATRHLHHHCDGHVGRTESSSAFHNNSGREPLDK